MQGMGNSFRYLFAKNYQHRTWFDRVIEKIKRVQVFASQGSYTAVPIVRVSFSSFWKWVVLPQALKKWVTLSLMLTKNG